MRETVSLDSCNAQMSALKEKVEALEKVDSAVLTAIDKGFARIEKLFWLTLLAVLGSGHLRGDVIELLKKVAL